MAPMNEVVSSLNEQHRKLELLEQRLARLRSPAPQGAALGGSCSSSGRLTSERSLPHRSVAVPAARAVAAQRGGYVGDYFDNINARIDALDMWLKRAASVHASRRPPRPTGLPPVSLHQTPQTSHHHHHHHMRAAGSSVPPLPRSRSVDHRPSGLDGLGMAQQQQASWAPPVHDDLHRGNSPSPSSRAESLANPPSQGLFEAVTGHAPEVDGRSRSAERERVHVHVWAPRPISSDASIEIHRHELPESGSASSDIHLPAGADGGIQVLHGHTSSTPCMLRQFEDQGLLAPNLVDPVPTQHHPPPQHAGDAPVDTQALAAAAAAAVLATSGTGGAGAATQQPLAEAVAAAAAAAAAAVAARSGGASESRATADSHSNGSTDVLHHRQGVTSTLHRPTLFGGSGAASASSVPSTGGGCEPFGHDHGNHSVTFGLRPASQPLSMHNSGASFSSGHPCLYSHQLHPPPHSHQLHPPPSHHSVSVGAPVFDQADAATFAAMGRKAPQPRDQATPFSPQGEVTTLQKSSISHADTHFGLQRPAEHSHHENGCAAHHYPMHNQQRHPCSTAPLWAYASHQPPPPMPPTSARRSASPMAASTSSTMLPGDRPPQPRDLPGGSHYAGPAPPHPPVHAAEPCRAFVHQGLPSWGPPTSAVDGSQLLDANSSFRAPLGQGWHPAHPVPASEDILARAK